MSHFIVEKWCNLPSPARYCVCVLLLALAELVEIRKTSIIASFVLDSFVLWGAMCLVLWKAGAMVCLWIWPRKEGYHLACVWWFECVLSYCFHKDRWNPTCRVWLLRTCLLDCLCAQKDVVLWILGISNTIAYLSFSPWQRQQKYCKRQHEAMMNNIKSKLHFDLGIRNQSANFTINVISQEWNPELL